jgi:hypothetical protein
MKDIMLYFHKCLISESSEIKTNEMKTIATNLKINFN